MVGEPNPQDGNGLPGERGGPVLAALAVAADMCTIAELNIAAGQPDQLGDPQPSLTGQQQQSVVATAQPGGAVRRGEQGVDLFGGEVTHHRPVASFGRDRQYSADVVGVFGCV